MSSNARYAAKAWSLTAAQAKGLQAKPAPILRPQNWPIKRKLWRKCQTNKVANELAKKFAAKIAAALKARTKGDLATDVAAQALSGTEEKTRAAADMASDETLRIALQVQSLFRQITELVLSLSLKQEEIKKAVDELGMIADLAPQIKEEMRNRIKENPAIGEMAANAFIAPGKDEQGDETKSIWAQIIDSALERKKRELPRVAGRTPDNVNYPTDKINNGIWKELDAAAKDSKGQFHFGVGKGKNRNNAIIVYGINFDELERQGNIKISKKLTAFDKRVYIAVSAIRDQNGDIMSAGQIYAAMGNDRQPAASNIQKINDSLTKLGAAHIYVSNTGEIGTNKRAKKFVYDGPLLPFERISAYINNGLCDSAIHIFREPPLMTFAKERSQITTIAHELLASPLNQTDRNLTLEDYFLEQIAAMKRSPNYQRKMLLSTIYGKCETKTKMQRQRAPKIISRLLDHYKSTGWIRGYKIDDSSITISI